MRDRHIVFISGAGRGIGKGITTHYLQQPNTIVIAGIRDLEGASAAGLKSLKRAEGSTLIPVPLDSTSPSDALNAIQTLKQTHNIAHIDTVIANAGICDHLLPIAEIKIDEIAHHIDTNVYGVLRLFQATWPLLQKSPSATPKFACVSSRLGSIAYSVTNRGTTGGYGLTKAAANYLVAKMAAENEGLVAFVLDPGFVQTDMGNRGAEFAGLEKAPDTVEDSAAGIVNEIAQATRESHVGRFRTFDGQELPW